MTGQDRLGWAIVVASYLLGSIPFLGRLFGARGRYSDKSKLYLLTTATIINYPELEARL